MHGLLMHDQLRLSLSEGALLVVITESIGRCRFLPNISLAGEWPVVSSVLVVESTGIQGMCLSQSCWWSCTYFDSWFSLTLGAHAQQGLHDLVCVCVCLSTTILELQAMRQPMSHTSSFKTMRAWKVKKKKSDFPEMMLFRRYGVKTSEPANTHC